MVAVVELAVDALPVVALLLVLLGGATRGEDAADHPRSTEGGRNKSMLNKGSLYKVVEDCYQYVRSGDEEGLEVGALGLVHQELGVGQLVPSHGLLGNGGSHRGSGGSWASCGDGDGCCGEREAQNARGERRANGYPRKAGASCWTGTCQTLYGRT